MTQFVYPRLPLSIAQVRIAEMRRRAESGDFRSLTPLAGVSHRSAAPVATGGRVADDEKIADVRLAVWETVTFWRDRGAVTRPEAAAFDLSVGRAIHENLRIVPADAGHDETWNFLTLVVLPDVAALRFPDLHDDRLLGTPRNVFRRVWLREEVLGDLQRRGGRPLGEDELVGLFERTSLARNRRLIRRLAAAVIDYDGPVARSEWARDLYKKVTFSTGPRLLEALTEDELDALIRQEEDLAFAKPSSGGQAAGSHGTQFDVGWLAAAAGEPEDLPSHRDPEQPRDVEKNLHRAMVELYMRAKAELGYNATYFIRMLANDGAIATARRLVMSERASEGFVYLWEHHRLDLTVESLVTSAAFAGELDDELVDRARGRLREYERAI